MVYNSLNSKHEDCEILLLAWLIIANSTLIPLPPSSWRGKGGLILPLPSSHFVYTLPSSVCLGFFDR